MAQVLGLYRRQRVRGLGMSAIPSNTFGFFLSKLHRNVITVATRGNNSETYRDLFKARFENVLKK